MIGLSDEWKSGIVKMVFHPMDIASDNVLNFMYDLSGINDLSSGVEIAGDLLRTVLFWI